jgi:hypothetical protein
MHTRVRILVSAALLLLATGGLLIDWSAAGQETEKKTTTPPERKISGPYTHENLAIFFIHGEDALKGRKFMLLGEAMEKKVFAIYETQQVNTLEMENLSATDEVLILSGDILKGGQQDRIAQHDQFVPPKSGKTPLTVFCVEHTAGRWMRKMTEEDKKFQASPGQLNNNALRLANRSEGNQSKVWKEVAEAQRILTMKTGKDVKAKESDSSLALSLQAKEVIAATDKYIAALQPMKDKDDVIGYAFAINGKVYMADIYGSPALFAKVWPRLLHASALEAFAELEKGKHFTPATVASVTAFLADADKGKTTEKEVSKDIRETAYSGENALRFDSKLIGGKKGDIASPAAPLRQNYLKKK